MRQRNRRYLKIYRVQEIQSGPSAEEGCRGIYSPALRRRWKFPGIRGVIFGNPDVWDIGITEVKETDREDEGSGDQIQHSRKSNMKSLYNIRLIDI